METLTALGFIKPKDFVNVRYVVYPELDLGLDFDPNTGVISGYPLELGNHTSEVKMKFLGGEYSTTVRVEVIETAVLKERVEGSPFAAPRTVAQLLLREEDLEKREQEIDYRLQTKRMDMEEEFVSKQISLEQQFEVERAAFNEVLENTKKQYEKILDKKEKHKCTKNEKNDCQNNEYLDNEKCECLTCEVPNPTCGPDDYYDPGNLPYCRNSTKYTKDGKKMYSCQPCPTCPDGKELQPKCGGDNMILLLKIVLKDLQEVLVEITKKV